jgi:hypothetical protein
VGPKSVAVFFYVMSVTTAHWTAQHRAFLVEACFKNAIMLSHHEPQKYCWTPENPADLHQYLPHSEKLTVACGVASSGATGPPFCETSGSAAVSLDIILFYSLLIIILF